VTRVRGTLRAVRWKDRQDVYILTNMNAPLVEGHFTHESGQAIKPRVVEDYNAYMGFVDKSDRMVNSYGIKFCVYHPGVFTKLNKISQFQSNTHFCFY